MLMHHNNGISKQYNQDCNISFKNNKVSSSILSEIILSDNNKKEESS